MALFCSRLRLALLCFPIAITGLHASLQHQNIFIFWVNCFTELQERTNKAIEKAKTKKEKAKTKEEKIAATELDEKAKILKKELADAKFNGMHLWAKAPNKEAVIKRITMWNENIKKMEMKLFCSRLRLALLCFPIAITGLHASLQHQHIFIFWVNC